MPMSLRKLPKNVLKRKIKQILFDILASGTNCCGASVASEQQHIEGGTNSRSHHFLPECIAFNQSALRHFLPECIAPRRIRGCYDGCHTAEQLSFFAWILVVIFCCGLPVKRREEDRA